MITQRTKEIGKIYSLKNLSDKIDADAPLVCIGIFVEVGVINPKQTWIGQGYLNGRIEQTHLKIQKKMSFSSKSKIEKEQCFQLCLISNYNK